jgi:predicted nucleic acid-binding protein
MVLIDSCGWLEYLSDGPLAVDYAGFLEGDERLLVPVVVLYEVYKFLKRNRGEETALLAAAQLQRNDVVDLDSPLTLEAADYALDHGLAMADALVYATARRHDAELVTSDGDFEGLPGVQYLANTGGQ